MNTKFNSGDNLPLKKELETYGITININHKYF